MQMSLEGELNFEIQFLCCRISFLNLKLNELNLFQTINMQNRNVLEGNLHKQKTKNYAEKQKLYGLKQYFAIFRLYFVSIYKY